MKRTARARALTVCAWCLVCGSIVSACLMAALSPLQSGRDPSYVVGALAGVLALSLLLLQPVLAAGYLAWPARQIARQWHAVVGVTLVLSVLVHIGGLYLASPPDMIDALLLVAPTPFSVYGVVGLWAVVLTAVLTMARRRLPITPGVWRILHNALAVVVVVASVVHAWMIEGTMGHWSKIILCISALAVTLIVVFHLRVLRPMRRHQKLKRAR